MRHLRERLEGAATRGGVPTREKGAVAQAIAQTQRDAELAVNTLARVMADPASPTNARVAAAVAILRFGREGLELDDLDARVAALEARSAALPRLGAA